jgi:geranylgeranyl pyrophosphate synthase
LATASAPLSSTQPGPPKKKSRRRKTAHLKIVPETKVLRQQIREKCGQVAARLDKSRPLSKEEMEVIVRGLLDEIGLPEGYVGWTMVIMTSAFWHDQVAAIPPSQRLFLLPHCLKHAEGCPADYDEFGLDCKQCGACSIADFRTVAEEMGYKVLVAEGSPIVLKIIVSGYVDAIIGVACLNVLEKAIDKILLAGIPCMAVPLLSSDCRNTSVDEDWVDELIRLEQKQPALQTRSYVHLMRAASQLFAAEELERLAPRLRGGPRLAEAKGQGVAGLDPIAATEVISYDFLGKGGKYSRPFITLAVYDALTGADGTTADGPRQIKAWPDSVRRTALSIETFHKASLVHDDIEDDDSHRYGDEALHRKYGTPTGINVGDYLIGLGYRLISREAGELGAEVTADIIDCFADAHMRLSEGQGAELLWRDALDKRLAPIDALKIYALKTAPAFEAALYAGIRLAGPLDEYRTAVGKFARNVGVAFQILNDLKDWEGDDNNKLEAGGDICGGRPTILWALALENLDSVQQSELQNLVADADIPLESRLQQVRQLYRQAGVFDKAAQLVDKYQDRAEAVADDIQPEELRRLFYYLVDTVLERPAEDAPQVVTTPLQVAPA